MKEEKLLLLNLSYKPISFEPVTDAFTRRVLLWKTDKGKIVTKNWFNTLKCFAGDVGFSLANLLQGDYRFIRIPIYQRVINEIKSRELFRKCGVKTSKLIYPKKVFNTRIIVENFVEGSIDVYCYLLKNPDKDCSGLMFEVGEEMGKIHSNDIALVDSRSTNILEKNGKKYFVDREFLIEDADIKQKLADVIIFLTSLPSSARNGDYINAFLRGYYNYVDYKVPIIRLMERGRFASFLLRVVNQLD